MPFFGAGGNTKRAVFSFQVVLSNATIVNNTLGKSINLLKCVCHASLSLLTFSAIQLSN